MKTEKENSPSAVYPDVKLSIKASQAKKAEGLCVLDLRELTSFTDYFIIMNGNSSGKMWLSIRILKKN